MFSLVKIPFTWDQMIIHFVFRFKDNLIVGLKSMTSPSTQSCEVRKCYLCQELLAWFFVFVTWQLTWLAYDRRNRDRIYYQDIWWVSLWKDSAVSHTLCHFPGNTSFFSSFFFITCCTFALQQKAASSNATWHRCILSFSLYKVKLEFQCTFTYPK